MNNWAILVIFAIISCASSVSPPNHLTVCISDGCVQGKTEKGNVKSYNAYYGIPFATPPTGELRFKVTVENVNKDAREITIYFSL